MANGLIEGLRQAGVNRLIWIGGGGTLNVGPDTKLMETEEFPEELLPLVEAHDEALELYRDVDDIDWSYIAPAAVTEPGDRTGEYRTAEGKLVANEERELHYNGGLRGRVRRRTRKWRRDSHPTRRRVLNGLMFR